MPDTDNWTVAMVLKWVLTGDLPTVLAMAESYGAVIISEDSLTRAVPEHLDAVMIAYCVDPTLPHGEERDKEAVLRSQEVIAAKAEICRALRRGMLETRARRNGSGDVEAIASNEWLALKFQSYRGHDLAVPIGIEQDILKLPHATEDYLAGRVPADVRPVVWPDPLFAAQQVKKIWSALERNRAPSDGELRLGSDQPHDLCAARCQLQGQANRPTRGAETKCESLLRQTGEDELVKRTKPYWRSKATEQFFGLSGRGFDRAWGNVAAELPKISKAGAKPKKNN